MIFLVCANIEEAAGVELLRFVLFFPCILRRIASRIVSLIRTMTSLEWGSFINPYHLTHPSKVLASTLE